MINIIIGFLIATFLINFFITKYFLINLKKRSNDINERWGTSTKSHFGGLGFSFCTGIVIILLALFNLFPDYYHISFGLKGMTGEYKAFMGILFVIIFTSIAGILDEVENLKPITKILLQTVNSGIILWAGFVIDITDNFIINYLFTVFWILLITNAVNMYDNIDFALVSFAISLVIIFLSLFYFNGYSISYLILFTSYLGCFLAFAYFNFYPSKLFMGDVGSFQIGGIFAAISIKVFWNEFEYSNNFTLFYNLLLHNLCFLVLLLDVAIVFIYRLKIGNNPFRGDTNHLSHVLSQYFNNSNLVTIGLAVITLLLGIIYIFLSKISTFSEITNFTILIMSYFFTSSILILLYVIQKFK